MCIHLDYWLLSPNICRWTRVVQVRGYKEPKLPKQDSVSIG
jgi:hypothetical protein